MEMQRSDQMAQLKADDWRTWQGLQLAQHPRRPLTVAGESHPLIEQQCLDAQFGRLQFGHLRVAQMHQMTQLSIGGRGYMNAAQLLASFSLETLRLVARS